MAILRRGPLQLLVDALEEIPFPDTVRERLAKSGLRGLGVVIGIGWLMWMRRPDAARPQGAWSRRALSLPPGASDT